MIRVNENDYKDILDLCERLLKFADQSAHTIDVGKIHTKLQKIRRNFNNAIEYRNEKQKREIETWEMLRDKEDDIKEKYIQIELLIEELMTDFGIRSIGSPTKNEAILISSINQLHMIALNLLKEIKTIFSKILERNIRD